MHTMNYHSYINEVDDREWIIMNPLFIGSKPALQYKDGPEPVSINQLYDKASIKNIDEIENCITWVSSQYLKNPPVLIAIPNLEGEITGENTFIVPKSEWDRLDWSSMGLAFNKPFLQSFPDAEDGILLKRLTEHNLTEALETIADENGLLVVSYKV